MPLTIKTYIDIAIGLLVVGLMVFAGWEYDQRKIDAGKMEAQAKQVDQLQQGLTRLQQGQAASDQAINNMEDAMLKGTTHAATVRQRVVTMGNDDEKVRSWLDGALPPAGCMLDDTCRTAAAASPALSGSAPALPASANHAIRNGS